MNKRNLILAIMLLFGWFTQGLASTESTILDGPITISLSAENTNCADDPNGNATVSVSGGKSPYSYKWSNGKTSATINNLVAGSYFITVTDALGSTRNSVVSVKANGNLQLSFNQRLIACAHGKDGKVVAIPEGGERPYTYQWSTGSKKSFIENVGAGMYMVTVTDANGCRGEETAVVTVPDPLRIKANYAHVSCGAEADGTMEVIASGGAGNYSFYWELDKGGGAKRENLAPGLYSVTVTDGNGCTSMICPDILQSQPPLLISSFLPETCAGEADGRATITPSGDSPPYLYKWSGGVSQHSTAFNLSAGTYTVTVTNFRNCSSTIIVEVGLAGGGFGFTISTNGATCGNVANGSASVNITGGVAPFKYSWVSVSSNTAISSNAAIDGLAPGDYSVMVTDVNGCSDTKSITIVEKPVPTVIVTATIDEVCFGESTGAASATASGGEGAYTYQWSNGQRGQTITNLAGGTYTVTTTDANACQATASVIIKEANQIIISEQVTNLKCNDEAGGKIELTVTGGSGNGFTYQWSNGATRNSINNILAGTYFVTVTDTDGCEVSKGINISQPAPVNISISTTNAADMDSSDGTITTNVSGGIPPYIYNWSNGANTPNLSNLAAGEYILTLTDANGCEQSTIVIVEATCTLMASITDVRPTSCAGNDGSITVTTFGGKGTVNYLWSNGSTTSAIAGIMSGFYGVTVTDSNGCQYASGAFVGDACDCNHPIIENVLVFEATCGVSDGALVIQMNGGDNNFNYQWSVPEISGTSATGLQAGSYHVTITDRNNTHCSIVETVNIGNTNIGPIVMLQNEPEICNVKKGAALLVPGNLTFSWSDGGTGNFRDDLSAGNYQVTATIPGFGIDECMDIISVKIGLESGLTITPVFDRLPDCGKSNGSVTITVAGGSGNYTYSWGAATQNNLPSGTFNITVIDKNTGCTESLLFTLLENVAPITIDVDSISNVSCVGRMDGAIKYNLTESADFFGPVSIIITDGKGNEFNNGDLPAGNYCIIAKDGNGCAAGQSCFEITQPELLFVDVTILPKTCNQDGTILLTSSGGNGFYTYDWADLSGEIDQRDRRGIDNGSYSVTVNDKAGCSLKIENLIMTGECFICSLEVTASIDALPSCGLPNGAATITVNNSFGNLSYSWEGEANRTDLVEGNYTVTVTDDFRGCEKEVSFILEEPELSMEATISKLTLCPDAVGKLVYGLSNFKCFSAPLSVTITDDQGTIYDENALPIFSNYIFIVKDGNGTELNRQLFSVGGFAPIIVNANTVNEGCSTLGAIDLDLGEAENQYDIQWDDLNEVNQTADRSDLNEGTYRVTITDKSAAACTVIREFVIDKMDELIADLTPIALTCDRESVQVTLNGEGIIKYDWSPANLITDGQGTATPTISLDSDNATVSVTASNAFGCSTTKEVNVFSVVTNPSGGLSSSPQCDGLTFDFASEGGTSEFYQWDFGDGTTSDLENPSHTYEQAGDYVVKLKLKPTVPCSDEKGVIASRDLKVVADAKAEAAFSIDYDPCLDEGTISFKDASIVNPGTINSWKWNFGNGLTSTEQNPVVKLAKDGDLNISLEIETSLGCNGSVSETKSFVVISMPKLRESVQICPGIPTELNPNPKDGVTYEWSPAESLDDPKAANPIAILTKSVNYTVKITQGECVREEMILVNVPEEQDFDLSEDEEVCDEEERLIFVKAPATSTIEWSANNMVISEESEIMVSPGIYQLKLTDPNGCLVISEVAIENFAISAEIQDNTDPCDDSPGLIEVRNNGVEDITSFEWVEVDGIISPDLNKASIEVDPSETTDYTVTLKNDFGCEMTLTETVVVSMIENMTVIPERDTIFTGETTPINIIPSGNYTVDWAPTQSLDNLSSLKPTASPTSTTTYTVTITDGDTDCMITREVTVFVKEVACGEPNIFFPNAFSPNGDGFNDILRVRGNAISISYFAVYNRWGEKVFESNDKKIGWNGTFNGKKVSSGVYGYYLRVVCFSGEVYETQGNVTVLH